MKTYDLGSFSKVKFENSMTTMTGITITVLRGCAAIIMSVVPNKCNNLRLGLAFPRVHGGSVI